MPRDVRTVGTEPKIQFPRCTPRCSTRFKSKKYYTGDRNSWMMKKQLYTPLHSFTLFSPQAWEGRASLTPAAPLHPWNSTHRLWALLTGTGLLAYPLLDVVNPEYPTFMPTHSIPQGWEQGWPLPQVPSFPEQKSLAALPHGTYCSWSCSSKRGQQSGEPAALSEWMGSSKCLQQVRMLFLAPSVSVFNLLLKSLCLPLYNN